MELYKQPPFSAAARLQAGYLLRLLQPGNMLAMPHSRPMPSIGPHCNELRIVDSGKIWRIVYRLDSEVIVVAEVFQKKTTTTPKPIIDLCKTSFRMYDDASQ